MDMYWLFNAIVYMDFGWCIWMLPRITRLECLLAPKSIYTINRLKVHELVSLQKFVFIYQRSAVYTVAPLDYAVQAHCCTNEVN